MKFLLFLVAMTLSFNTSAMDLLDYKYQAQSQCRQLLTSADYEFFQVMVATELERQFVKQLHKSEVLSSEQSELEFNLGFDGLKQKRPGMTWALTDWSLVDVDSLIWGGFIVKGKQFGSLWTELVERFFMVGVINQLDFSLAQGEDSIVFVNQVATERKFYFGVGENNPIFVTVLERENDDNNLVCKFDVIVDSIIARLKTEAVIGQELFNDENTQDFEIIDSSVLKVTHEFEARNY